MQLIFRTAVEFACLAAVLLLLNHLAAPLASPELIMGRGNRYVAQLLELRSAQSQSVSVLPVALVLHAGKVLVTLALTGWLALVMGRLKMPVGATLLLCTAIWLFGIAALPVPLLRGGHTSYAVALGFALLLLAPVAARLTKHAWQPTQQAARVWLYPLWVLLTGLGLLWLMDYSARAALSWRHLAAQQFYALLAASMVLTMGAGVAPTLVTVAARVLARLDGIAQPAISNTTRLPLRLLKSVAPQLGLLAVLLLWCAGVLLVIGLAPNQSALRAELIRWITCIFGGWLAYRWLDDPVKRSVLRGGVMTSLVCAAALLPMAWGHDNGQIMLLGLAAAALLGGQTGAVIARPAIALILGLALTTALLASAAYALYEWGPLLSPTIAKRIAALKESFASSYEYLSEIRWFLASAPVGGHGFGAPWCGTQGSLADAASCPGMPKETHSDYVIAALAGLFGNTAALAIAAATAAFLLGLLHSPTPNAIAATAPQPLRLAQWVVTVFVGISLMQLFVTCLGGIGLLPLTGVTFPLLSYSKSSLLVIAFFAALAINKPCIQTV